MRAEQPILSVGHSRHPIERFLRLLAEVGVEAIADVRRLPGSRRNPQFNARALADSLRRSGIDYAGFGEELGGRRGEAAGGPGGGGARAEGPFAAYARHMGSEEFVSGLARLEVLARERRTAFMCAEADWRRCHRRLIADALAERGWRVLHLLPRGEVEEHPDRLPSSDRSGRN